MRHRKSLIIGAVAVVTFRFALIGTDPTHGQGHRPIVHALFNLNNPEGGPFPSDWFTIPDPNQNTGLRVNLPKPNCSTFPSDCEDLDNINTLDGFNLQPRISIPFDGPIDLTTVNSSDIFLIGQRGQVIGINQTVWDPDHNVLYVESDELLDQGTRYALIVTNGVRSESGAPVETSLDFHRPWSAPPFDSYQLAVMNALRQARQTGAVHGEIVSASVFTTLSATAALEKIREQLPTLGIPEVTFNLGPAAARTNFKLSDISSLTLSRQVRVSPASFSSVAVDLPSLRFFPAAVGGIAYGKYKSPDYLVHPGEFMPPIDTRTGTPSPTAMNEIYFNVIYPAGIPPADGWPVVIYGHGAQGNKDEWMARVAGALAARGIATVGINNFGTGFGPLSAITVQEGAGSVTFPSGGRSIDQNQDNIIDSPEGIELLRPNAAIFLRDAFRQQVVDWMQLVRVIQHGVDYDGDGKPDLNPKRIYYIGQSHGGMLGTILSAVEPAIRASVLNTAGGSVMEHTRLSAVQGRRREGLALTARFPSLLNSPGITALDGVIEPGPFWFENKPMRDGFPLTVNLADGRSVTVQAPVINQIAGALDIQRVQEWKEWCSMPGDPIAYASHLRKSPLAGMPEKQILIQFYKGDPNVENPQTSALIRAGDLKDRATYYRHDLAFADNHALAKNPHQFYQNLNVLANQPITLALQWQSANFVASDGQFIGQPLPMRYFEVPIQGPLPEILSYIP